MKKTNRSQVVEAFESAGEGAVLSVKEVAADTGLTTQQVHGVVNTMLKKGEVQRKGVGKYAVAKPGTEPAAKRNGAKSRSVKVVGSGDKAIKVKTVPSLAGFLAEQFNLSEVDMRVAIHYYSRFIENK